MSLRRCLHSACLEKMAPVDCVAELAKVENAVSATLQLIEDAGVKEKSLFPEEESINLSITLKQMPSVKYGNWKEIILTLPYSPYQKSISVCLIVKDLEEKNSIIDDDTTIRYYKEILDNSGITSISEIIPFHMLRTEFKAFEAKRRLANSYDVFVADARVYGYLPQFFGKEFRKRKKLPFKVNVQALHEEVPKVLRKSKLMLQSSAASTQMIIGRYDQEKKELVKNIVAACQQLRTLMPGGWANINTLHLKTRTTLAIPIYVSSDFSLDGKTEKQKKETTKIEPEEVSTVLKGKVVVYPKGKTKIVLDKNQVDEESDIDGDGESGEKLTEKRKSDSNSESEMSETENELEDIEKKHVAKRLRVNETDEKVKPKTLALKKKLPNEKLFKKRDDRQVNRNRFKDKKPHHNKKRIFKSNKKPAKFGQNSQSKKTNERKKASAVNVDSKKLKEKSVKTKGRFNMKRKQKQKQTVNGFAKKKD